MNRSLCCCFPSESTSCKHLPVFPYIHTPNTHTHTRQPKQRLTDWSFLPTTENHMLLTPLGSWEEAERDTQLLQEHHVPRWSWIWSEEASESACLYMLKSETSSQTSKSADCPGAQESLESEWTFCTAPHTHTHTPGQTYHYSAPPLLSSPSPVSSLPSVRPPPHSLSLSK